MRSYGLALAALLACSTSFVRAQRSEDELRELRKTFPEAILALAFSPDGQLLATGGIDDTLRLWNRATGMETLRITAHKKGVQAVAFSPDGKWILTGGGDKQIRIWDLTGKEVATLDGHDRAVTCLVFTPDGKKLISGSYDKTVRIWNFAERKEASKFTAHESGVISLSLTSDNLLVTNGEKTEIRQITPDLRVVTRTDKPKLWSLATLKEVRPYDIEAFVAVVSFDRKFLATAGVEYKSAPGEFGQNPVAALRDAATGKILTEFKRGITHMAFSPDGKILAIWGIEGKLRLIETITGQDIYAVPELNMEVFAFSPDGKRLACGELGKAPFAGGKGKDVPLVRFLDIPPQPEKWATLARDADLADLWTKLASKDSVVGYEALWTLAAVPEKAVPLFKERLKAAAAGPDLKELRKLIAELDSDVFAVRRGASLALQKLGPGAEIPLRQALDSGKLGLEARRRVQELIASWNLSFPLGEALRDSRALQALDWIGTPESLALIRTLAEGPPASLLTQDAQLILQRRKK